MGETANGLTPARLSHSQKGKDLVKLWAVALRSGGRGAGVRCERMVHQLVPCWQRDSLCCCARRESAPGAAERQRQHEQCATHRGGKAAKPRVRWPREMADGLRMGPGLDAAGGAACVVTGRQSQLLFRANPSSHPNGSRVPPNEQQRDVMPHANARAAQSCVQPNRSSSPNY